MPNSLQHETVIVVDVETTGMQPEKGDRVIEIGAVKLRGQQVLERFERLIRPDFLISQEIESLTGITNNMLQDAPGSPQVMAEFVDFIGTYPFVAHNAAFDQKFIDAELTLFGRPRPTNFYCTLQLARRLYHDPINYKLSTLVQYKNLTPAPTFHRALADAEMTAQLWLAINNDIMQDYGFTFLPLELLKKVSAAAKEQVGDLLRKAAKDARHNQLDTTGSLFG
ncbi:MAG: 3'-5' exonuclease [Desulfuromonadales bacterium]|nr:3'-5' exonuclease [Desulfuromonadales bacterium]